MSRDFEQKIAEKSLEFDDSTGGFAEKPPDEGGSRVCTACGYDHEDVRAQLRSSLFATAKVLCGFRAPRYPKEPSERLHGRICAWVESKLRSGETRICVMIPRDHLKTSILNIAFCVWQIINSNEVRIFDIHKSSRHAEGFVGGVKDAIMSEAFRHYFPELVPDPARVDATGRKPRWSADELEVPRPYYHPQATVAAFGIDSSITGGHVHIIILDDLIDPRTAKSVSLMDTAIEFRRHCISLLDDPERGVILVIGTLWPGGFYEEILESARWQKLVIGCRQDERTREFGLTDEGQPIWPEGGFNDKTLGEIEEEYGSYWFAHQYENRLASKSGMRFDAEDLRYFWTSPDGTRCIYRDGANLREVPRESLELSATVDPSTGTGNDDTAITVIGYDRNSGHLFVLQGEAERTQPRQTVERIFHTCTKFKLRDIGIEESGAIALKSFIDYVRVERGFRANIIPLKHMNKSKTQRIVEGLLPFVQSHHLFIRKNDVKIVKQMREWNPESKRQQRDDLLDSLAYHQQFWQFRKGVRQKNPEDIPLFDGKKSKEYTTPPYGLSTKRRTTGRAKAFQARRYRRP